MSNGSLSTSIIVPAYREAPNLRPLVQRLFTALAKAGIEAELIIVDDDSQDGTEEIVNALRHDYSTIQLITRRKEKGLSSAVLKGFEAAHGENLVVMDADLQHPPEMIPDLIEKLVSQEHDFVIGTRYASSGVIDENWPWYRRWASWLATLLAHPLTPISDPMSGFFALKRTKWEQAEAVNPIGYKIGLELYVKCGCRNPGEVPIRFAARQAGQSKLGLMIQLKYLQQLGQLYWYRYPVWILTCLVALIMIGIFTLRWISI